MVDVFVDTSAWYALRVANDRNHASARQTLEKLVGQAAWLHTSDWVVVETLALLSRRVSPQEALRSGRWIFENEAVHLHSLGDEALGAWSLYRTLEGKVSLVDCGSFTIMEKLGISKAFAFDQDFQARGFSTQGA